MSSATLVTALLTAAATLIVFAVMFAPLERLFPARARQRAWRRDSSVDLTFFAGQYLLWSALALIVLHHARLEIAATVPATWRATVGAWPLWARAVTVVVLGDLLVYGWHRACHAVPLLWRFHAVHHTAESLDWLAAHREHPFDGVTTQLAQNLPAMALGLSLHEVGALVVIRGAWAVFIHSNVRLPTGPLRFFLGAPELHHHHHAREPEQVANYANLAPWIDVLFRTYHRPRGQETYALGVVDPAPRGYLALLWWPFTRRAARAGAAPSSSPQLGCDDGNPAVAEALTSTS